MSKFGVMVDPPNNEDREMMPSEYLDAAKARMAVVSDYELAKRLDARPNHVIEIRHGKRHMPLDVAYRIALTFRNAPDDWVDPVLGVPADGPHIRDVSWTTTRIMAHYPDGAVKYRFVGPEVIEGGSASYASHVGIVAAGTDPTVYIVGVTNGTITDTVAWPYDGVVPENGDILAVARPDTRIGTRVTFLMKSSAS